MSANGYDLILSSSSLRRAQILDQMGVRYKISRHHVNELRDRSEGPEDYVLRMAEEKAMCGLSLIGFKKPVLGADTIVYLDRKIFGKPANLQEALSMLRELSGRKHCVYTSVAIADGSIVEKRLAVSEVTFRDLDHNERLDYCNTGEPFGKAGGYAIQGFGAIFIKHLTGSFSGVVGLPIYQTSQLLKVFRVPFWQNK